MVTDSFGQWMVVRQEGMDIRLQRFLFLSRIRYSLSIVQYSAFSIHLKYRTVIVWLSFYFYESHAMGTFICLQETSASDHNTIY